MRVLDNTRPAWTRAMYLPQALYTLRRGRTFFSHPTARKNSSVRSVQLAGLMMRSGDFNDVILEAVPNTKTTALPLLTRKM